MAKAPVTAIIAVRNGAEFIGQALHSVYQQTLPPEEVIVVDDGSTDETAVELQSFPEVCVVRQAARGQLHAQNQGVRLASKPYLTFIDADDVWLPTAVESLLAAHSSDAELDFVYGLVAQFSGSATAAAAHLATKPDVAAPGRALGAMIMKRKSFLKVGPFPTRWTIGGHLEWWTRVDDVGLRGKIVPEVVLLRRIHERNLGRTAPEPMRDYLNVLHSIVNRRRGTL